MPALGEEGDLAGALLGNLEGVAVPLQVIRAVGAQTEAAALRRQVGVEVEDGAGAAGKGCAASRAWR